MERSGRRSWFRLWFLLSGKAGQSGISTCSISSSRIALAVLFRGLTTNESRTFKGLCELLPWNSKSNNENQDENTALCLHNFDCTIAIVRMGAQCPGFRQLMQRTASECSWSHRTIHDSASEWPWKSQSGGVTSIRHRQRATTETIPANNVSETRR